MRHYIVLESDKIKIRPAIDRTVLSPKEFISMADKVTDKKRSDVRIINLCSDYDYLSMGYYCSLMAEARGNRCIPSVGAVLELNWKRLYEKSIPELNELLQKTFKEPEGDFPLRSFHLYFGRTQADKLQDVGRRIFDTFRCPILEVEIRYKGKWEIVSIEPVSVANLSPEQFERFHEALDIFTGSKWVNPKSPKKSQKWVAILHDPKDKMPPSNPQALKKFIQAADALGAQAELITRQDMSRLMEYDALLIRETTAIDNHTFRFARKAEAEGIAVIDDPDSIMRCCNKVFLFELLNANKIPTPKTTVLDKKSLRDFAKTTAYPMVLKVPDGAFSVGVVKVRNDNEMIDVGSRLLADSAIILAQEFMPSEFDWRVGILNGKPIFVCQYFMAPNHWQIYNHGAQGDDSLGEAKSWKVDEAPKEVMDVALAAAKLIGNGLYGVDLKQNERGVFVIEINDNPNVDSGYPGAEDEIMGMELYKTIIQDLLNRSENMYK
jgi:glutathione synthase/RimK-type ligase-like ATP-grasp enzyme